MLFNSFEYIFLFLPITLIVFYRLVKLKKNQKLAIVWLVIASLFFYAWWNPPYLALLVISICINYALGISLAKAYSQKQEKQGKLFLIIGILFNLGLIGYYKYSNFFINNINDITGASITWFNIILPLGISFFTFQQISYLIDSSQGQNNQYGFIEYCLFVSFFPQLIAGPIVNHKEMLPQFSQRAIFHYLPNDMAIGLSIFSIGLFKKVVISDQIALYSTPFFNAASQATLLTPFEAWTGALAYALQLYFDFSGYSDMAIGAARMFGIKLPLNFNSPYKATNIIDFWGRWHMTLTRFLTQYLYHPLAMIMSRRRVQKGKSLIRRGVGSPAAFTELIAVPTIFTMFLAGVWHGAGWQYIIFGLLHGFYLTINHGWNMIQAFMGNKALAQNFWRKGIGQIITLIAVVISMVFFRSPNVKTAMVMLTSMSNVEQLSSDVMFPHRVIENPHFAVTLIILLFAFVLMIPNTQEWLAQFEPALNYYPNQLRKDQPQWLVDFWEKLQWRPTRKWAIITATIGLVSIFSLSRVSEFIYFQF